jgi:hypothetical protein
VMFWWDKAALATRAVTAKNQKPARRFGFITTNSLTMTFNRRVLEPHLSDSKKPLSLIYAIPDHPWVDAAMGAAVRIAMTVGRAGRYEGKLRTIAEEVRGETEDEGRVVRFDEVEGKVFGNLSVGADISGTNSLKANSKIGFMGVIPVGLGFEVTKLQLSSWGFDKLPDVVRPYLNGSNLVSGKLDRLIVDFFGHELKDATKKFPQLVQHVQDEVKPFRDQVQRKGHREKWWLFGEQRHGMRVALNGLPRFIATTETAKHRVFSFVPARYLPDQKLRIMALDGGEHLAVLRGFKFEVRRLI